MPRFQIHNVLKIADVQSDQFTIETLTFLTGIAHPTWEDKKDSEDIYNMEDVIEEAIGLNVDSKIIDELEKAKKFMEQKKCSYIRIVNF